MSIPLLSTVGKYAKNFRGIHCETRQNLFALIAAILQCRTVCLYKCAHVLPDHTAKATSRKARYKRLIYFFSLPNTEPIYQAIILTINAIANDFFVDKSGKVRLVMDRTNWKIGQQHVNLLVVGVLVEVPLYRAVFVPIVWQDLGPVRKRGNSSTSDREALLTRAIALLGGNSHTNLDRFTLLADREFVGQAFWNTMSHWGLHFIIRLRAWMHLEACAKAMKMSEVKLKEKIEADICRDGCSKISFELGEHTYHLLVLPHRRQGGSQKAKIGTLSEKAKLDEKYLFIASDTPCWDTMADTYGLRWKIECCFKHLKTNGFNLESLNLRPEEKINLMFAILALLYMIALREGILYLEKQPDAVKLKTYREKVEANEHVPAHIRTVLFPEISLFRLGFDIIVRNGIYESMGKMHVINNLPRKIK